MLSYMHQPRGFYRRLLMLMLPVVVQNLITTSLGLLDTFMVGLLGSNQMSAVTVANVPVFIMQLIVFGLQSGSSVLFSQFWGKGDRENINRAMGLGFMIAGSITVIFAAVMFLCPVGVLRLITDNELLIELGRPYIRIVGFSYIFNSLSSIYIGMQRSIENAKFGMLVFAASMCCNTLGNYILIFGKFGAPALGITGAAIATLLSRVLEFVICAVYALRCRTVPLNWRAIVHPGTEMLHRFVRYSAPVLANETLWGTGASMFTVIMGHMDGSADIIAAYTVAGNIDKLATAGIFGTAAATAVIIGKEIGVGTAKKEVQNMGLSLCTCAVLSSAVLGAVEFIVFRFALQPYVLPLFGLSLTATAICSQMLLCYIISMPFHGFASTMVVGVLRGGGDVRASLVIDIVPLWFFSIPLAALLGLVLKVPTEIFCLYLLAESLLKTPIGIWRLRSGKWIHDVTVE